MSEFTLALVSLIPASFFNSTTAAAVLVVNSPVKASGLIPLHQKPPWIILTTLCLKPVLTLLAN